jgi:hypothetical protein
MVERFLYGLDEKIQRDVAGFCKEAVTDITKRVLDQIDFEDPSAKQSLKDDAKKGEDAFVRGLQERAFSAIRTQSQAEIEDMVEFMPKPELARMAEALVNLTSIKRRVSRGVETVGGPIDVAVISHAEGFVWVKRKHYFSAELNPRYFERVKSERDSWRESHVDTEPAGNSGASRRNDRMPRNKQKRDVTAPSGGGKSNA